MTPLPSPPRSPTQPSTPSDPSSSSLASSASFTIDPPPLPHTKLLIGTSPASRPSPPPEDADPFTDPDASPSRSRSPKGKSKVASSTPGLRQPWSTRGRVDGWSRSHAVLGPGSARVAASQTFTGGANQSFLHLINALSLDDPEDADSSADEARPAPTRPPRALSVISSDGDDDDESPPSFVSPLPGKPTLAPPAQDLSSSLYAIHRPIAARRRTIKGEKGEVVEQGVYVQRGDEVDTEGEGQPDRKERKQRLADKLADVFGLEGAEEVVAEFPCWLFRSVLLQGFMYLTSGHICFYAYLPHKEGVTIRSEGLSVRGTKTRRYYRHWFVLKDALLSWYPSSTEPYFPDGHIDLHYCTSVEASLNHPQHFKVGTAEKKWHFSADSAASRDEWVKTLKRVVFRCQNEGESVKISIPLETVLDIERSSSLDFAETIRIRVYDADEGYSIDEYWLSYFTDLPGALSELLSVLEQYRSRHPEQATTAATIVDTTQKGAHLARAKSLPPRPASSWSALSSRLRLFSAADRSSQSVATLTDHPKSGATTPSPRRSSDSVRPPPARRNVLADSDDALATAPINHTHTYPPEPSSGSPPPDLNLENRPASTWGLPTIASLGVVPEWLKGPPKRLLQVPLPVAKVVRRRILEAVTLASVPAPPAVGQEEQFGDSSTMESDEDELDHQEDEQEILNDKLRTSFGLTDKEHVVASFQAYLFRGLPIYGKVYVSTTFLCFRSLGIAGTLAKTKMILPLSDIIAVSKHRSYRIGYSGLIVVIKGHEELFFELHTAERRDACLVQLELQAELVHQQLGLGETPGDTLEHQQHLDLLDLAASSLSDSDAGGSLPQSVPVMFCSTSSDFVTFRPEKSLNFTCLTIGSRGDVQPYIALCKGLMAEGHKCKIASHGEYRAWVEGHGIAFEEVGGDPAELMQLMIAHDFFTISFMKEALGHFRGWLDELLETTWKACQGADVLIESPSAIAGYHIAEALRIPYFRAFTMPWSRTRAYPHAFAVPDHKMGGSYNYMTYTMFDQIFWRATSGQINRWRKKSLGLRSTSLDAMQQHKIPFLYNFSPVIIPPPLDWRENIHVTGYWWLDNPDDSAAKKWQPPPELLAFLESAKAASKKVVFIGFGSIIIPDPEEMTRVVTEAVEQAGVFAVVAKGWSDRAMPTDASDQERREKEEQEEKEAKMMERPYIFKVRSIPHDWLFPRISAAVHHGGAGTTGASLRAGLPTIIKPWFGDQHFYADRVATLGIGSAVRNLTVENLAAAIITAVTDGKQIARARLAGENIRKEDGVGNAIQCIYRDLEYARSLVPPPPVFKTRRDSTSQPSPTTASFLPPPLKSTSAPASPSPHPVREASDDESETWDIMSAGSSRAATWDDLSNSQTSSITSKSPARSGARSGPASSRGGGGPESDDDEALPL